MSDLCQKDKNAERDIYRAWREEGRGGDGKGGEKRGGEGRGERQTDRQKDRQTQRTDEVLNKRPKGRLAGVDISDSNPVPC